MGTMTISKTDQALWRARGYEDGKDGYSLMGKAAMGKDRITAYDDGYAQGHVEYQHNRLTAYRDKLND